MEVIGFVKYHILCGQPFGGQEHNTSPLYDKSVYSFASARTAADASAGSALAAGERLRPRATTTRNTVPSPPRIWSTFLCPA
jgi:hypothetical protein